MHARSPEKREARILRSWVNSVPLTGICTKINWGRVVPGVQIPMGNPSKKCVEHAKIRTPRADWRGRWVSFIVDISNIKRGGGGGIVNHVNRVVRGVINSESVFRQN